MYLREVALLTLPFLLFFSETDLTFFLQEISYKEGRILPACERNIMDIVENKIKEAQDFRDHYFIEHPKATPAERTRAVREKVLPLIQVCSQSNF